MKAMKFGVVLPPREGVEEVAALADGLGFDSFWLYDTPLAQADPYIHLGRCANVTSQIELGVGVTSPRLRSVGVTACALATLEKLAPERAVLGIGTGNTGRQTFGMPPVRLAEVEQYVRDFRDLQSGSEITYHEDGRDARIRFLHSPGFVSTQPVKVIVAAAGEKAARTAGRVADGLSTYGVVDPAGIALLRAAFEAERQSSAPEGRVITMTAVYVADRPEERFAAAAQRSVGHVVLSLLAFVLQNPSSAALLDDEGTRVLREFAHLLDWPGQDPSTSHQRLYHNYLGPIEDRFVDLVVPSLIETFTLCGDAAFCRERISALEEAGLTDFVFHPAIDPVDEVRRFHELVMA
jgi:alkanesulfonate monooxygenase SsuD/methylene tetrahydromethanopterin reductase-like flavin-dependent oxidoreductase (luciferase family)